jgi:hypothetical protein
VAPEWSRFTGDGPDALVRLADGSTEFGRIPDGLKVAAGPIELQRGWHDSATDRGMGLIHIEARHGEQIRAAGYADAAAFVADLAARPASIRATNDGGVYLLRSDVTSAPKSQTTDALVVRLKRDDSGHWTVVTAGPLRNRYLQKAEPLWSEARITSTLPAGQGAPSTSPPEARSGSAGSLNARVQSSDTNIGTEPPTINAKLSPELEHATRLADEAVAAVRAEVQAGRLGEADLFELRAADIGVQQAQGEASAASQAAACLLAKGSLP